MARYRKNSSTKTLWKFLKLEKITINMGLGEAKDNAKIIESAVEELALIIRTETCCYKGKKVHR